MRISALSVPVYRFPIGDASNNGISARFTELLVYCPNGARSFFSEHELPLNFCMVTRGPGLLYIVPAMVSEEGKVIPRPGWWMYGGNIADTSDSRWHELTTVQYPLRIYDRREW